MPVIGGSSDVRPALIAVFLSCAACSGQPVETRQADDLHAYVAATGNGGPILGTTNCVLIPWDSNADSVPFDPAISARRNFAVRVTASQLRALAGAASIKAWVTDENGRSPEYRLVVGQPSDLLVRR